MVNDITNKIATSYWLMASTYGHQFSIHEPQGECLQAWFRIITNQQCQWDYEIIVDIFRACVILYNMILEDECDDNVKAIELSVGIQFQWRLSFAMFMQETKAIDNSNIHLKLCAMTLLNTCGNLKAIIEKNTHYFSFLWCNCVLFQKFNYNCIVASLCFNKWMDKLKRGIWV